MTAADCIQVQQYHLKSPEDRERLALRAHGRPEGETEQRYAGLAQEERILDWLHDCYFSAVSGDAPAFEAWYVPSVFAMSRTDRYHRPTHESFSLHEYILALWGMPLGEMLDLERLAQKCKEHGRYTFFFSSAPANVTGGVSSHVNGQAIL